MMMLVFFLLFFIFMHGVGTCMFFSVFIFFSFGFYLLYGNVLGMIDLGFLDYFFYMDLFGFLMVMLTMWGFSMIYLMNYGCDLRLSFYLYYVMFISLMFSFLSSSLFMYYIFFEFSMVPIFFLIVSKGGGQDRVLSSYYMMVYTLLSSLPSLFIFMDLYLSYGLSGFNIYMFMNYDFSDIYLIFVMFMFMVKVPLFFFHIWLPKAHVDAPVEGSMVLASIMLKLGGYGIIRVLTMFSVSFDLFMIMFCVGVIGGFLLGVFCLFIVDVKVLIAYSSVVHMCLMVCGVMSGSFIGYLGGVFMMVSHGICSSCMFMMANLFYSCSGSRCLIYNKGIFGLMPIYTYFWLGILVFNIGLPPSLSIISEIYSMMGMFSVDYLFLVLLVLGLFFLSCCMFNLYNSFNLCWGGGLFFNLLVLDYACLLGHYVPLFFSIFFVTFIL